MALSGLVKRSATGIIYVACIVCSLIFLNGWPFMLLCMIFCLLGMLEFRHLLDAKGRKLHPWLKTVDIVSGLLCVAIVPLNLVFVMVNNGNFIPGIMLIAIALAILLIVRLVSQLYIRSADAVADLASSMLGFMYVAVPLSAALLVYSLWGAHVLLIMFIMIWLNDTGAFCVGSMIGRRRLFERISPKKSWEGFWGGMVFCIGAAFLIHFCFGNYSMGMGLWRLVTMAVIVSVISTWGDLVESLIKRTVGVKDSGHILPGHGGILDRIDSLLLTAPALFVYLAILLLCKLIV